MTARAPHIGVVGGGILGLAVARRLLEVDPNLRLTVLEKEAAIARHQTGRNSGVAHAGIYYEPGSLKAQLCRRGVDLLRAFAGQAGLRWQACGKLIVALDERERAELERLFVRAQQNGVPGIRYLPAAAIGRVEPEAAGVAAIHSPTTAIVDFRAVAEALARVVAAGGGAVATGQRVVAIDQGADGVRVRSADRTHNFDHVVICAGLESDWLARMAGDDRDPQIVPFRGEYYQLRPEKRHLVRGLIYPVPDPRYPFLGVHLTKRHDGEVLVGPNAVLALAREGYRRRDVSAADLLDLLRWPGFRRLARRHWRTGLAEFAGSVSRRAFIARARRYVPALTTADVVAGPVGIRAQAVARDGSLLDDFRIGTLGRVTAIRNAPSPGATSALAIAEYIVRRLPLDRLAER